MVSLAVGEGQGGQSKATRAASPLPERNRKRRPARQPGTRSTVDPELPELFALDDASPKLPVERASWAAAPQPVQQALRYQVAMVLEPAAEEVLVLPMLQGTGKNDEEFLPYRDDAILSRLPEAVEELISLLTSAQAPADGMPLETVLQTVEELEEGGAARRIRWPFHWRRNPIPLRLARLTSLEIRFVQTEQTTAEGERLFVPEYTLAFVAGARPLSRRNAFQGWASQGFLGWYQEDRNWFCYRDGWFRELRFLRRLAALGT